MNKPRKYARAGPGGRAGAAPANFLTAPIWHFFGAGARQRPAKRPELAYFGGAAVAPLIFFLRLMIKPLLLALCLAATAAHAQKRKMPPKPSATQVYDSVAQPAVPLGGTERYAQFLADHQRYPAAAMQQGQQGTVPVRFVVEKTGVVSGVEVVAPVAPLLDAEAVRLIKSGPRWTPARHRGLVVRQRVVVPVSFVLSPPAEPVRLPAHGAPAPPPNAADIAASAHPDRPAVVAPDRPAQPVGGTAAFFTWIEQNQQYPKLARQRKIQGKVPVEFLVQPDGRLTDARVLKKMGSGLDEEALRLIRTAPKWEPATYQGKPLKQKMVLPVLFQL